MWERRRPELSWLVNNQDQLAEFLLPKLQKIF